jgi:hypothetical protein
LVILLSEERMKIMLNNRLSILNLNLMKIGIVYLKNVRFLLKNCFIRNLIEECQLDRLCKTLGLLNIKRNRMKRILNEI